MIYMKELETAADNAITNYCERYSGSENSTQRHLGTFIHDSYYDEVQNILHEAANFDDLFDKIRLNEYISEHLKPGLMREFRKIFEAPLYTPPTDKELLQFLDEGRTDI